MTHPTHQINFQITFRNTESTEPLRQYAEEKLGNAIRKFTHHDTDAHVVLLVEKNRHIAEVSFRADGHDFNGREESSNLYASIDTLADSVANQLRRHKEKITKHH